MPPTSTDATEGTRRRLSGVTGAGIVTAVLVTLVAGGIVLRGGSGSHRPTLRSAAIAASVDADRLARDRASRSEWRDEPVPPKKVTVTHDGSTTEVVATAATV